MNYPNAPTVGQEYSFEGRTWVWTIAGAWKQVPVAEAIAVRAETAAVAAADSAALAAAAASTISPNKYQRMSRKRVVHRLPLMFPDYDAILLATGQPYIYPQAFAIDDAANEVFVLYCAATDGAAVKWVAVFNHTTSAYKSCFNVGPNRVSEGLVVRYEGGNRYIYTEDSAETLGKYDITVLPATMANIPATATYAVGMDRQFAYRNGVFLVEQSGSTLGSTSSRTTMAWYDSSLARMGAMFLGKSDTGFTSTTDSTYAPYLPKRQNIALGDGILFASFGGYKGRNDASTGYGYQGIKAFTLNGDKVDESIMDPILMMQIMEDNDFVVERIENEGVVVDDAGNVFSMYVHRGRTSIPAPTTDGLVIFEEFSAHPDAIDFAPAVRAYPAYNQNEIEDGIWPRADGLILDPITGASITTLEQMIFFMSQMDVKSATFYSSSHSITDIDTVLIPTGYRVTIENENNTTFDVTLAGYANIAKWRITGSAGDRVQEVLRPLAYVSGIRMASTGADLTQKLNRVTAQHYDNDEQDFMALDIQTTAANNSIFYGGGSGSYNAATRHVWHVASNTTTLTGTERMRLDNTDGLTLTPVASATPNNNGEMLFENTSNTMITLKSKGSDGVVRSAGLFMRSIGPYPSVLTVAQSGVAVVHTGTLAETVVATITLPPYGPNDKIDVQMYWGMTNNSNNKTPRVRYGGTSYFGPNITTNVQDRCSCEIRAAGSTNAQFGGVSSTAVPTGIGTSGVALATSAVNSTANSTLTITAQLSNIADTMTLIGYTVYLTPAP